MRSITSAILGCAIALSVPQFAGAKTLRDVKGPAEVPPASFKGTQYVDSKGCVFIRAGYGGRVTWIPRVNRQRKVYCSKENQPSLTESQLAALGKKPVVVKSKPKTKTTTTKVASTTTKPKTKTKTKAATTKTVKKTRVAAVTPTPDTSPSKVYVNPTPTPTPAPVQTKTVRTKNYWWFGTPKTKTASASTYTPTPLFFYNPDSHPPQAQPTTGATTTVAAATTTKKRRTRSSRYAIRTTPQAVHPGDLVRSQRLQAAAAANQSAYGATGGATTTVPVDQTKYAAYTRDVTDPIYNLPTVGVTLDEDVTAAGDAQMELVWTNTVPRKLVKKKTRGKRTVAAASKTTATASSKNYTSTRKSSKGTTGTTQAAPKASRTAKYVQVATFGVPANANKTVGRFQSQGLPVATRAYSKSGKTYNTNGAYD